MIKDDEKQHVKVNPKKRIFYSADCYVIHMSC